MNLPIAVKVEQVSIKFFQPKDDLEQSENDVQSITISTEDAGAGIYYIISTERWAISDIEELTQLLEAFEKIIK